MSDQRELKISFSKYLTLFPTVELPVQLGEDSHHAFASANKPLPDAAIQHYLLPLEVVPIDEDVTEYIACFSLPSTDKYHAIVYWKAELLNYQYRLVTYDLKGQLIDQCVIAGTTFDGEELTRSAAVITEDRLIYIVSGQIQEGLAAYDAQKSTASRRQMGENGKIVEL